MLGHGIVVTVLTWLFMCEKRAIVYNSKYHERHFGIRVPLINQAIQKRMIRCTYIYNDCMRHYVYIYAYHLSLLRVRQLLQTDEECYIPSITLSGFAQRLSIDSSFYFPTCVVLKMLTSDTSGQYTKFCLCYTSWLIIYINCDPTKRA